MRDAIGERRWIATGGPDEASLARERPAEGASESSGSGGRAGRSTGEPASGTSDWIFALRDKLDEGQPGSLSGLPHTAPDASADAWRVVGLGAGGAVGARGRIEGSVVVEGRGGGAAFVPVEIDDGVAVFLGPEPPPAPHLVFVR